MSRVLLAFFFASTLLAADPPVPYLVRDLTPQQTALESRVYFSARTVGNVFYFGTDYPAAGLWRTDGTAVGTYRVAEDAPGRRGYLWQPLFDRDGILYYPVVTSAGSYLYRTDGTTAGTQQIAQVPKFIQEVASCQDRKLCFVTDEHFVGVSDGTAAGTSIVTSTAPGVPETNTRRYLTSLNGKVYFNAYDDDAGRCVLLNGYYFMCGELWMSDGTKEGTRLMLDLVPGPYPSSPRHLFAHNGWLYFYAYDRSTFDSCYLWVSDGTAEGTHRFKPDVAAPCAVIHPRLTPFRAHTYIETHQDLGVLQTDGTAEGTRRLVDILGWTDVQSIRLYPTAERMMLLVNRVGGRSEMWSYDGERATKAGDAPAVQTVIGYLRATGSFLHVLEDRSPREIWRFDGEKHEMVFTLPAGTGTVVPWGVTPDFLAFEIGGGGRWVTDGTTAGTRRLDLTSNVGADTFPAPTVTSAGHVFFVTNGSTPQRFWASDGSYGGTVAISDENPRWTERHDRGVYFGTDAGVWTSDGTVAGTALIARQLGVTGSVLEPPAYLGSTAVFAANGELMRRDGGGAVTTLGITSGSLYGFQRLGQVALFWASDATRGWSLQATDGTREGTRVVFGDLRNSSLKIGVDGQRAFFTAEENGSNGTWLYVTDGTTGGTKRLAPVADSAGRAFLPEASWQGVFYFRVDGKPGLWRSDGTPDGTWLLSEATVHSVSTAGDQVTLILMGSGGWEVWKTDGTKSGTVRVVALGGFRASQPFLLPDNSLAVASLPGDSMGEPGRIEIHNLRTRTPTTIPTNDLRLGSAPAFAGGRLFFSAMRPHTGSELWAVPLGAEGPRAEESDLSITWEGFARIHGRRAAIFRVRIAARGPASPTVVASTVAGTLREGVDYEPFSRRILFTNDNDVTLVVPIRADASGTVSVALSSPTGARVVRGLATASIDVPRKRRPARP